MTAVVHDVYEMNLASSGRLKLRAKALLAEGTPDEVFRACVLLHDAARIQRLAVQALPACPPVTLLSSLVEECWCFVEGRDPLRAAETWGLLLLAREAVDAATAEAILSRLSPRFEAFRQEFARLGAASPTLRAMVEAGPASDPSRAARVRARKELGTVLARFPGAMNFWWMLYRLAEMEGNKAEAWDALSRARQLAPDNARLAAMSLVVAVWALPAAAAEQHLAGVRGTLDRAVAEVCLLYALAEIVLARVAAREEQVLRWERAREAAEAGLTRADTPELRSNLKATQLLLRELLAGREPTMEVLYRSGLGKAAALEKPDANVVDFLTTRSRHLNPELGHAA